MPRPDLEREGRRLLARHRAQSLAAFYRACGAGYFYVTPATLARELRMTEADRVAAIRSAVHAETSRRLATPMTCGLAHDGSAFDDPADSYARYCRAHGIAPHPASTDWAEYKPFQKVTRVTIKDDGMAVPAFLRRAKAAKVAPLEPAPEPAPEPVRHVPADPAAMAAALLASVQASPQAARVPLPRADKQPAPAKAAPPTCPVCGSLLSAVTWTCVRGEHCKPVAPAPMPAETLERYARAKVCPRCGADRQSSPTCRQCGTPQPVKPRKRQAAKVVHMVSRGQVVRLTLPAGFH